MSIRTLGRRAKLSIAAVAAVIFSGIIATATVVIFSSTVPASAATSVTSGTNPSPAATSSPEPWG